MDELSQWCEIDGHQWEHSYFSYGLVLGPKTVHMNRVCVYCKKTDNSVFIPMDVQTKHWFPILGPYL